MKNGRTITSENITKDCSLHNRDWYFLKK